MSVLWRVYADFVTEFEVDPAIAAVAEHVHICLESLTRKLATAVQHPNTPGQ